MNNIFFIFTTRYDQLKKFTLTNKFTDEQLIYGNVFYCLYIKILILYSSIIKFYTAVQQDIKEIFLLTFKIMNTSQIEMITQQELYDMIALSEIQDQAQHQSQDLRRIVTNPKRHPYNIHGKLVSQFNNKIKDKQSQAVIIHQNLIITNAHAVCYKHLKQLAKKVMFYPHIINNQINTQKKGIQVLKYYIDPHYFSQIRNDYYDIALLQLSSENNFISENQLIQPNFQIDVYDKYKKKEPIQLEISGYSTNENHLQNQLYSQKGFLQKFYKGILVYKHTTESGNSGTSLLFKQQKQDIFLGIHKASLPVFSLNYGVGFYNLKNFQKLINALKQSLKIRRQFKEEFTISQNRKSPLMNLQGQDNQLEIQNLKRQIQFLNKELIRFKESCQKASALQSQNQTLLKQIKKLNQNHQNQIILSNKKYKQMELTQTSQRNKQLQSLKNELNIEKSKRQLSKIEIINLKQQYKQQINQLNGLLQAYQQQIIQLKANQQKSTVLVQDQNKKKIEQLISQKQEMQKKYQQDMKQIQLNRIKQVEKQQKINEQNILNLTLQNRQFQSYKSHEKQKNKNYFQRINLLQEKLKQENHKISQLEEKETKNLIEQCRNRRILGQQYTKLRLLRQQIITLKQDLYSKNNHIIKLQQEILKHQKEYKKILQNNKELSQNNKKHQQNNKELSQNNKKHQQDNKGLQQFNQMLKQQNYRFLQLNNRLEQENKILEQENKALWAVNQQSQNVIQIFRDEHKVFEQMKLILSKKQKQRQNPQKADINNIQVNNKNEEDNKQCQIKPNQSIIYKQESQQTKDQSDQITEMLHYLMQ